MIEAVAGGAAVALVIGVAVLLLLRERRQLQNAKQSLARLAESEERLAAALRGSDDGVWDWDIVTDRRWYAPRWWTMLGYEPNELPSDDALWESLAHPDDKDRLAAATSLLLSSTADQYVHEFTLRHKAGHWVPILARGYIQRDESGKPIRLSGTNTDLTERRRVAQERETFERKLQESQKLESLGVLAGGIAHDFNNLLTGVLGNASLAMHEVSPGSNAYTYLTEINDAASRAAELCRQMLAYSGRGRFVVTRTLINPVIEQTAQLLQLSIDKHAVLRFELGRALPPVEVDVTQVRQALMNLVVNASEAQSDAGGVITVSTGITNVDAAYLNSAQLASALEPGEFVHIEVTDTGSGMTPDVLARIFEPFYSTKFTGRGLGLAAVLGIVRGHRGSLKVYSEAGRGSTFKLLFPSMRGELEDTSAVAPPQSWKGSGTILVVDDEPAVRRTVSRMLQLMGFTTLEASDGAEGIELFKDNAPRIDLVMLDLTMPRLDGEQTFAELRRVDPNVRVVLMSGFNQQEAISRFTGKGLASFVQKPFSLDSLRSCVQRVFTS
ncbi:MAG: response regulator [Phycisphaerae bacterium]|nr:response regulator [Gemmatimonadaceae bacterium]